MVDKAAKAEAKKENKSNEKPQLQDKGRRFRADLLLDEKITAVIAFGMLLTMTGLLLSGDVVALVKANMRGRGK